MSVVQYGVTMHFDQSCVVRMILCVVGVARLMRSSPLGVVGVCCGVVYVDLGLASAAIVRGVSQ